MHQSRAAFLEKAGDEADRRGRTEWAARRYRQGGGTFSERASEAGLAVEEIMEHLGGQERGDALEMFLTSCRTVAETQKNRRFLRLAEQAVASLGGVGAVKGDRSVAVARAKPIAQETLSLGELREPRASYVTQGGGAAVRWRAEGDRVSLVGASDVRRAQVDSLIMEFGRAKPGGKGGSAALAETLASEWDAGFLSRGTVERLARWCHSSGPGYRGRP